MTNRPPIATVPIPDGRCSALLYGGSFDPPHRAHLTLPGLVRERLGLDLVVYVPAARSPHKAVGPSAPDEARVEMLRAGLTESPSTAISTYELDAAIAGEPSYTVRTLEAFHAERPRASFCLLIGVDQALSFHRWREAERIVELAPPAVMLRGGAEDQRAVIEQMRAHWSAGEIEAWSQRFVDVGTTIEASSSRVRELLADDPESSALDELLPPGVRRVIRERRLYE